MGDWGRAPTNPTRDSSEKLLMYRHIVSTSLFWAVSFTNKQFWLRNFFFRMCGGPLKCGGPGSAEHVRTLVNPALRITHQVFISPHCTILFPEVSIYSHSIRFLSTWPAPATRSAILLQQSWRLYWKMKKMKDASMIVIAVFRRTYWVVCTVGWSSSTWVCQCAKINTRRELLWR